jgi:hypothetical protein
VGPPPPPPILPNSPAGLLGLDRTVEPGLGAAAGVRTLTDDPQPAPGVAPSAVAAMPTALFGSHAGASAGTIVHLAPITPRPNVVDPSVHGSLSASSAVVFPAGGEAAELTGLPPLPTQVDQPGSTPGTATAHAAATTSPPATGGGGTHWHGAAATPAAFGGAGGAPRDLFISCVPLTDAGSVVPAANPAAVQRTAALLNGRKDSFYTAGGALATGLREYKVPLPVGQLPASLAERDAVLFASLRYAIPGHVAPIAGAFQTAAGSLHVVVAAPGLKLEECLTTAPPPTARERLTWCQELAAVLARAHALGIVHRHVKPGRVCIDGGNKAVLWGFPLGYLRPDFTVPSDAETQYTATHTCPSVLSHTSYFNYASDVYSFGVLLWEVLSWQVAFPDAGGDVVAFRTAVAGGRRPATRDQLADPRLCGLGDLIAAMWDADQARRPTMANVARELAKAVAP